jgi:hypothetical protein
MFEASLTDNARVIIYSCHMLIVQATGVNVIKLFDLSLLSSQNKLEHLYLASLSIRVFYFLIIPGGYPREVHLKGASLG